VCRPAGYGSAGHCATAAAHAAAASTATTSPRAIASSPASCAAADLPGLPPHTYTPAPALARLAISLRRPLRAGGALRHTRRGGRRDLCTERDGGARW